MPKLSVCIISKNEEDVLEDCLKSVSWVDEILVVDSGSTDATIEIAQKHGAKVVMKDWLGFGPQRQFAEQSAQNDWIFAIDCDEVVSDKLKNEILSYFNTNDGLPINQVFFVNRLTKLFGRYLYHGEMHPDRIARIYNKKHTGYNDLLVHEKVRVEGCQEVFLKNKLFHYYKSNFEDYSKKLYRYAEDSAQEKFLKNRKSNYFEAIVRAIYSFIKNYILKWGFLDGKPGYLIAKARYVYTYNKYDLLIKKYKK